MEQKAYNIEFVFNQPTELPQKDRLVVFMQKLLEAYKMPLEQLTFIFASDEEMLKINKDYLNHDYYTDIITFDYRESKTEPLNSDIYISPDTVSSNAKLNGVFFNNELHRVLFHGVLHLLGFNDKTEHEALEMRKQEEKLLMEYFG